MDAFLGIAPSATSGKNNGMLAINIDKATADIRLIRVADLRLEFRAYFSEDQQTGTKDHRNIKARNGINDPVPINGMTKEKMALPVGVGAACCRYKSI